MTRFDQISQDMTRYMAMDMDTPEVNQQISADTSLLISVDSQPSTLGHLNHCIFPQQK